MKLKVFFLMVLMSVMLVGCYDNDEIDELANVTALGIEKEGFTFSIADTGSFSGEGDKGSESKSICYFSKSKNIENAIDDINRKISKKLSFSHMSVIIASKYSAKQGIYETVKYFDAMPDVRPQTLIAISETKPYEYLDNLKLSLEVNPEKYFLNIFQKSSSYIPVLKMSDYTNSVTCSADVIAPLISSNTSEEENTEVTGAVLLSDGKMRAILNDLSILGLLNSTKNVSFDYGEEKYIINSLNMPKISVKPHGTETLVNISLHVGNKNNSFNDERFLENRIKKYLNENSKKGYDIFNFSDASKKAFKFQSDYDNYDWKSQLLRCKYDVNVTISDGE